jgi:hypothetical protein
MSDVSVGVYPWLNKHDWAQALGALRLLRMHIAAYACALGILFALIALHGRLDCCGCFREF